MQFYHANGPSRSLRKVWSRHEVLPPARSDGLMIVSADRVVADALKISSGGSVEVARLKDVLTGGEVNVLVGGRHLVRAPPPPRCSVVEGGDLVTLGPSKSCRRQWPTTLSDALVEAIAVHKIEIDRERWRKHPDAPLLTTRARFFRDYNLSEEDLVGKDEPNHDSRLGALLSASDDAKRAYYGHPEDAAWIAFFGAIGNPLDDVTWVKTANFFESVRQELSPSRDAPPFLVSPRANYSATMSTTANKPHGSASRRGVDTCSTGDRLSALTVGDDAVSPQRSAATAREELLQSFRSARRNEAQHPTQGSHAVTTYSPPGSPRWLEEFYEDPASSPLRNNNLVANRNSDPACNSRSEDPSAWSKSKTIENAAVAAAVPEAVVGFPSSSLRHTSNSAPATTTTTTHQPAPPSRISRMECFDLSKVDQRVGLMGVGGGDGDFAATLTASALVSMPTTERYLGAAPPAGKRLTSGREYRQEMLKAFHTRKAQGIANNAIYRAALEGGLSLSSGKPQPSL